MFQRATGKFLSLSLMYDQPDTFSDREFIEKKKEISDRNGGPRRNVSRLRVLMG